MGKPAFRIKARDEVAQMSNLVPRGSFCIHFASCF